MQDIAGKKPKKVAIIDYQLGNLFSVKQACDTIGLFSVITSDPKEVLDADALILPGVGAFGEAMRNLELFKLIDPIKECARQKKPLFGICLGQQLLFSESEEFGASKGLGLVPGVIRKFSNYVNGTLIKVPQIAWNQIYSVNAPWSETPLKHLKNNDYMYFVHSYYAVPEQEQHALSLTNYEDTVYCSSVMKDNIFSTQFHPEKSAATGLAIYKNWAEQNSLLN